MVLDIVDKLMEDGMRGAGMVLLLVLAYKIYKMKITSESNCCPGFKLTTSNSGGEDLDTRLSENV
tara:strand:- start:39 stop:233 length:195 start_codon:yes stop_codon:yes gene_type:complete